MAGDMMSFYAGNEPGQTPGLLPEPYYWWEGGALMGALIDYWYYTGDDRWNDVAMQGLLFQVGPHRDYIPPNQTMTEGNDDQGFWGMAALSAAEYRFPNPPRGQPQWLALAQAVFDTQAARWDTAHCGGGLRWQIFQWNKGYDYKNAISQACFFNMAARLALYTGDDVYARWADRVWDWMLGTGLMARESCYIYDGAHIEDNCTGITTYQWTYNAGAFLLGAAAMYNHTADSDPAAGEKWRGRVDGLLGGSGVFFIGAHRDIMAEVACEGVHLCDEDQQSFKAYLARWMAATTKWAPWTYDTVRPLLQASSVAAAQQCTGGSNGRMCGLMWAGNHGAWDGTTGVGQQMAAMEVVLANLIRDLRAPVTSSTGGTSPGSPGDPSPAGVGLAGADDRAGGLRPVPTADRAGAWLLTVAILVFLALGLRALLWDDPSGRAWGEVWHELKASCTPRGGILPSSAGVRRDKGKGAVRLGPHHQRGGLLGMNLDGAPAPLPLARIPRGAPPGDGSSPSSASGSSGRGPASAVVTFHREGGRYPDEQPWRRPARQGDFAGAIDPTRGDGAGFGIMELPRPRAHQGCRPPPVPSSAAAGRGKRVRFDVDTNRTRELKLGTGLKLQRKPLPPLPGLGSREQQQESSGGGDRKVWGHLL